MIEKFFEKITTIVIGVATIVVDQITINCEHCDNCDHITPPQIEQIYVIRVPARGGALTCVYALLMTKNEEAYNAMYNFINQACINQGYNVPNPRLVHCDLEVAAHNAARTAYPGTDIKGCFYHLCQIRVMPLLPSTGTTHNLIKTCVKFCLNLTGHVRAALRFVLGSKNA